MTLTRASILGVCKDSSNWFFYSDSVTSLSLTEGFISQHEQINRALARLRPDARSSPKPAKQASKNASQLFIDSCRSIAFDQVALVGTNRQAAVPDFYFKLPSTQSPHGLKIAKEISALATGHFDVL